ncbi:MAG: rhomboid family intramembrane serine protease [Desulfococcaceae bacterium]
MTDSSRNSLLCPNCNRLVAKDEPKCPHCGVSRPGAWWKSNPLTRGLGQGDLVIRGIIVVNVAFFAVSLLLWPVTPNFMNPLRAFAPSSESLFFLGATGTIPIAQDGRWWTLVSAGFLHGSLLHIIFNMLAFRQLGALVIHTFGVYRMVTIYLVTGVLGFLASYLAGVAFTIGASASVCGLIGASLYYGKSRGGSFGEAVFKQTSGWLVGLFLIGLMPGINNWGHGGGILAGILAGFFLGYTERRREGITDKLLALTCALVATGVLAYALTTGIWIRITS